MSAPTWQRHTREIDLAPIREAFARSGLSASWVAKQAGMDSSHVCRLLREVPVTCVKRGKKYGPYPYRTCTYETAAKLAPFLPVDPYELGI